MTQLKIKKTSHYAILPKYQTAGAAAFDLHSVSWGNIDPGGIKIFETGLEVEVPAGFVLLIFSRSGMGFKNRISLNNSVGVIDSDYRGPLMVALTNDGEKEFMVASGDRIAQGMLVAVPFVDLVEVKELTETARGTGGLGSTGV